MMEGSLYGRQGFTHSQLRPAHYFGITVMKISTCKLCLCEKELCKSHIIPDFMYEELFDEKHRLFIINTSNIIDKRPRFSGVYEILLCQTCENTLSVYENYMKGIFSGDTRIIGNEIKIVNKKKSDGLAWTEVSGLDYTKVKLFTLSILWKASVSTQDFFRRIKLGPYEEKIRNMILNRDPGSYDQFGCMWSTIKNHTELPHDLISEPVMARQTNGISCHFYISGFDLLFLVSDYLRHSMKQFHETLLNEKGVMKIYHLDKSLAKENLNWMLNNKIFS